MDGNLKKGEDYTGVTVVYLCHDGQDNYLLNKRLTKHAMNMERGMQVEAALNSMIPSKIPSEKKSRRNIARTF